MSRKERIYNYVKEVTKESMSEKEIDGIGVEALIIAQDLNLDRANVSKELNSLWKEGKILKIQTRPVLFLDSEEIKKIFSINYLPSVIYKDEKLSKFIFLNNSNQEDTKNIQDPFDSLIGSKDSLSLEVAKAKAAVSYPPHGLNTLILGKAGVGKWKFAHYMHEYALNHEYKRKDSKIIRMDCHSYKNSQSNFDINLFGATKGYLGLERNKKGLIDECNNGIIFLDNIHQLNSSYLDSLKEVLEKNTYSRVGETINRNLDCMVIASSTITDIHDDSIKFLLNYFPVNINIPNIDSRNLNEKIELILSCFSNEAVQIKLPIRFHKDILAIFVLNNYEYNLTELKNEVKLTCSRAFIDSRNNELNVLAIGHQHLSLKMLQNDMSTNKGSTISRILSMLDSNYILIDTEGNSTAIKYFSESKKLYGEIRLNQFVNEFNVDIETMNNLEDYISENISCLNNCGNAQIKALENAINPSLFQVFLKSVSNQTLKNYSKNPHQYFGLLLHLTNLITKVRGENYNSDDSSLSNISKIYSSEYNEAVDIINNLNENYQISCSKREIDFVALYLAMTNNWSQQMKASILLISHGEGIATEILNYINEQIENEILIDAIDYKKNMQFNDLLECATVKAHEMEKGNGVLIISDFAPLLSISDYLRVNENIQSRTISNLSLGLVIEVIEQVKLNKSLNQISQYFENKVTNYKEIDTLKEKSFVDQLVDNFISTTTTFLDARKSTSLLLPALENIASKLSLPVTKELTVKFLCHGVHMLERVIKKEPLNYQKINQFTKENSKIYHVIEKNFREIEEVFGITIPGDEIAFIIEIFIYN